MNKPGVFQFNWMTNNRRRVPILFSLLLVGIVVQIKQTFDIRPAVSLILICKVAINLITYVRT